MTLETVVYSYVHTYILQNSEGLNLKIKAEKLNIYNIYMHEMYLNN